MGIGEKKMDELKVELAIDIMQRKIAHFIRNNKETNLESFKEKLQQLVEEEEKLYELDEETIQKVYEIYLKEIKEEK